MFLQAERERRVAREAAAAEKGGKQAPPTKRAPKRALTKGSEPKRKKKVR